MKAKLFPYLLLVILCFTNIVFGAENNNGNVNDYEEVGVYKDGVIYVPYSKGKAYCVAYPKDKGKITQVTIHPKVIVNNEAYIVDRIANYGFANCSKLKMVTIPATIHFIDQLAFMDDNSLEAVTFLSNKVDFQLSTVKWAKDKGPFAGCNKIRTIFWPNNEIPVNIYQAFRGNSKAPYLQELAGKRNQLSWANNTGVGNGAEGTGERPSFASYVEEKVTNAYNVWQKKKPYESAGQYAERASSENREKKKRELFEDTKNEYLNLYTPKYLQGKLLDYDSDYKVYTVKTTDFGDIYAQVPLSDRTFFEDNWSGVDIVPTFNIIDNEIKVIACDFRIGNKIFHAPLLYDDKGDDLSSIEFDAQQLNLDDLRDTSISANQNMPISSTVNIAPVTGIHNSNTYAFVIGNENYKYVEPVSYALSDASTFARYCKNTLGIPEQNIIAVQDVTKGELRRTLRELQGFFEDEGEKKSLVVYYAGHGIPDNKNSDSLILPVDASASDLESCYSLQELYNHLGEFGAKNIIVYMDACFTGSTRQGKQMIASRAGVDFVRSHVEPRGNTIVISATSANETAHPYNEEGHGIFTYYLLDKLQSTQGNVSIGDLIEYVTTKVKSQSLHVAGKKQVPSTIVSPTFQGDWRILPVNLKNE